MKRYSKPIMSAEADEGNPKLQEMMTSLKDDFDFILSGLDKLDREGATEGNEGLMIAESLSDALQGIVSEIAEKLS